MSQVARQVVVLQLLEHVAPPHMAVQRDPFAQVMLHISSEPHVKLHVSVLHAKSHGGVVHSQSVSQLARP